MGPEREEIPGSQFCRQTPRFTFLEHVDHYDDDQYYEQRCTHTYQHLPASQWQAEDKEWQKEKAADDVDSSKPAVGGGDVAQTFSQPDGEAGDGDWIPEKDARDVEQEVDKGNLVQSWANIIGMVQLLFVSS